MQLVQMLLKIRWSVLLFVCLKCRWVQLQQTVFVLVWTEKRINNLWELEDIHKLHSSGFLAALEVALLLTFITGYSFFVWTDRQCVFASCASWTLKKLYSGFIFLIMLFVCLIWHRGVLWSWTGILMLSWSTCLSGISSNSTNNIV